MDFFSRNLDLRSSKPSIAWIPWMDHGSAAKTPGTAPVFVPSNLFVFGPAPSSGTSGIAIAI